MTDKVKLQLGDVIEIIAPNDTDIHQQTYYINYYDPDNKIRLEEANGDETTLTLTDGMLDNESIESIIIKSRAEESGYAMQNNLIIGTWIDVFFGGDLPLTITGKISNLVEDKIEITTYPDNDVIFIDFGYKGLPEELPIERINIRKAPAEQLKEPSEQLKEPAQEPSAAAEEDLELADLEKRRKEIEQELFEIPEEEGYDANLEAERQTEIQDELRTFIFNADQIHFGEDLDAITQMVDVPEEEQRYDIDKQLDDLLDDMLSTVPNAQRTDTVKNEIHMMIRRFKELRDMFSIFDSKGYALMPKAHGTNYKPLIETMEKLNQQLYWILPVSKTVKKLYEDDTGGDEDDDEEANVDMGAEDTITVKFMENGNEEKAIVGRYEENDTASEANKYIFLQKELNPYLTPFLPPDNTDGVIANKAVNTTITSVVDNFGKFASSVRGTNTYTSPHRTNKFERKRPQGQKRFALQTYTTGSTLLDMTKVRGDNPIIKRKKITLDDKIAVKSILTLQEPTVRFSRINMQTCNILDKSNLNQHFLNYWQLLKAKTHVKSTTITDVEEPYNHEAETFLKGVHNYMADLTDKESKLSDEAKYNKFLDKIIPKTRFLFEMIKPYLVGKLSVNDILTYLEPFMIYQSDLTFIQHKEMNEYIREKIQDYRKHYHTKSREYGNVKGSQNVMLPSLIKILDENPNLRTKVLDVYGFTDTIMQMSNSDFIKRIIEIDNGAFYNNAIALISTSLMIADGSRDMTDIEAYLHKAKADEDADANAVGKTGKKATAKATAKAKDRKERILVA